MKKMNKRGLAPLAIVGILLGILFVFSLIGVKILADKLSDSPLLIFIFMIGVWLLIKPKK